MKNYGFWCGICNIVIFIILVVLSILVILNIFEEFIVRVVLIVLSLFLCGYIEEKIVSKYVNGFIEHVKNKL
ncbi:MAG: hypothetical protein IJ763_01240 [Lachnospiraceae bacterium]|nr:hypothetical protein [Lachnospiraceae bacterium]